MINRILFLDWALWFFWIMATTWGWLIGSLILPGVPLVISGFTIAVFQWLVLQGRIARPWRWIIAGSLGWTAGFLMSFYLLPPEAEILTGLVIGSTTGFAQWLILRRELHWAGWWIVFSTIGWITGLHLLSGLFLTGVTAGALTGVCLEILLRNPRAKSSPARSSP